MNPIATEGAHALVKAIKQNSGSRLTMVDISGQTVDQNFIQIKEELQGNVCFKYGKVLVQQALEVIDGYSLVNSLR